MNMPELLQFLDGRAVLNAEDWEVRRAEILEILREHEYGDIPPVPDSVTGTVRKTDKKCCSGHAVLEEIDLSFETEKGIFSFPFHLFVSTDGKKHPFFVLLNFRPDLYDKYYPVEELVDNGFALAVVDYQSITKDNGDFTDGLAGCFSRKGNGRDPGKITLWAYAASRMLDYLLTRDELDGENAAVIGHSRLGKTALWCAAQDERFRYAFSNDSGCAGAALERFKHDNAESHENITARFPYWFCENYLQYRGKTDKMPFDQHFLVGAIAPRFVGIGSASKDLWADPVSEQFCCHAASPAWKINGKNGFIGKEEPAEIGESFHAGEISYHLRDGIHFLGRADWLDYMAFIKENMGS